MFDRSLGLRMAAVRDVELFATSTPAYRHRHSEGTISSPTQYKKARVQLIGCSCPLGRSLGRCEVMEAPGEGTSPQTIVPLPTSFSATSVLSFSAMTELTVFSSFDFRDFRSQFSPYYNPSLELSASQVSPRSVHWYATCIASHPTSISHSLTFPPDPALRNDLPNCHNQPGCQVLFTTVANPPPIQHHPSVSVGQQVQRKKSQMAAASSLKCPIDPAPHMRTKLKEEGVTASVSLVQVQTLDCRLLHIPSPSLTPSYPRRSDSEHDCPSSRGAVRDSHSSLPKSLIGLHTTPNCLHTLAGRALGLGNYIPAACIT